MKARQAGSARHFLERDRLVVPTGDEVGGEQDPAQQLLTGRRFDAVDALRLLAQRLLFVPASRTRAIRCARSSEWAGRRHAPGRSPGGVGRPDRRAGGGCQRRRAWRASRRTSPGLVSRARRRQRRPRRRNSLSPPARRRPGRRPPASGCADPDRAGSSRFRGRRAPASCPRRDGPGDCARPDSPHPAAPRGIPASAPPGR